MNYWLVKTEPSHYSWEDLVKDGSTCWDGVRNYAARKHLQAMQPGDQVLIYHSMSATEIVGIAEVSKAAYPDPTTKDDRWVVVNIKPLKPLIHPVSLQEIKTTPALKNMALVRISRLSVQPVTKAEFQIVLQMSNS